MENSYIKKFELADECEIDIDALVKVWDNKFFINQYDSPVSKKSEYRLIEYVKEFEEPTKTKVTISEQQAKEIISRLNLIPIKDVFFRNNIGWQTEQRVRTIENKTGISLKADTNALKVYMSMEHSFEEAKQVFDKVFDKVSTGTPARINRKEGVIEVPKSALKLKPHQKEFMAWHEILHFEHHRKTKHLRRKITGKQVQELIDYLSDVDAPKIKEYVVLLKKDLKYRLWWYNFGVRLKKLSERVFEIIK